ncbi:hypothetical protein [Nocardioides sp.]|uniref:hypothetical protein n=1 Tax=Nocardioides sp. TaxID=35761 RepID=UPI002BF062DB|nr:hypothetical protein [Nocardioides sp.]HSX69169.1 hypothetical protein [Nocardioides sp.]
MPDRDPLQQLASFGTGGPVDPLPATEVRRLGDRRRARRTAVASVTGVAAVLAVVVPAGLYAARDGSGGAVPPGTSTSAGPATIPADFPLDREAYDFGENGQRSGPAAGVTVEQPLPCGRDPLASRPVTDRLGFANEGDEFRDHRQLLLYADESAAAAAMAAAAAAVEGCTTDPGTGAGTGGTLTWTALPADTGFATATYRQGVQEAMGGRTFQLTRVGRAVLQVAWIGEGGGDVAGQSAVTEAIAPAMCGWSASGCASPSPTETPGTDPDPAVKEIADDFPLMDGFPERSERGEKGYVGPNRTIEPIALEACGAPVPDLEPRDRLLGRYESAEDYRTRQLTTYADAESAVAASRALVQAFKDCPSDGPDAEGYTSEHEVQKLTLGGESWAILDRATFDGGQTPFGSTLLVVRVGRAVLVEEHGGHAGYPNAEGIQELSQRLATPIAVMCAFTQAGCGDDAEPSETAGADGGFGPSLGGLRLGEDLAQVESAGWSLTGTGDCRGLLPPGGGHMEGAMYQEGIGVASVVDALGEGTPEGIKTGSSKAALQDAYPTATFTGQADAERAVVRLDGPGQWEFTLFEGEVVSLALVHDDATCTA